MLQSKSEKKRKILAKKQEEKCADEVQENRYEYKNKNSMTSKANTISIR